MPLNQNLLTPSIKLLIQRHYLEARENGLLGIIEIAAKQNDLNRLFAIAIAEKESGIRNLDTPDGYKKGPFMYDSGNAKVGNWKSKPWKIVFHSCKELGRLTAWADTEYSTFSEQERFRIAAAAYNTSIARVNGAVLMYDDCDRCTSKNSYGLDIVTYMKILEEIESEVTK